MATPATPKNVRTKAISYNMLLSSTSLAKSSKESNDAYLQRVTHFHLQSKGITNIECLEVCSNLKVLYLYDNCIERIENLDLPTLQYLYIQTNRVQALPELSLPSAKKIYLDENEISFVTGLGKCSKLEELHISRQRLDPTTELLFDSDSLQAVARTLQVLNVAGNNIRLLGAFTSLYNLRKFLCEDNKVDDMAEIEAIISLPNVEEANFTGNPVCEARTYRDFAIGASSDSLKILDTIPVLRHQQLAIRGYTEKRKRMGRTL